MVPISFKTIPNRICTHALDGGGCGLLADTAVKTYYPEYSRETPQSFFPINDVIPCCGNMFSCESRKKLSAAAARVLMKHYITPFLALEKEIAQCERSIDDMPKNAGDLGSVLKSFRDIEKIYKQAINDLIRTDLI